MTGREKEIYNILRRNPLIQQNDIAELLNISRSSVAGHIMNLIKKGYIKGKGYILSDHGYSVTIGSTNMDIFGYATEKVVSEDSNPGIIKCTPGGVGRNIALNISLLGYNSQFISVVGEDFYGDSILDLLNNTGVSIENVHRTENGNTSTYLSLLDDNGEMVVAINDMQIIEQLTPSLLARSTDLIFNASVLVVDCNLTAESLEWIFTNADKVPIFVDTVSAFKAQKISKWLSRIHTLKPNKLEAEILSGITMQSPEDTPKVAEWFHSQGVQRLSLSMGSDGVYFSEKGGEQGWSKPIGVDIVNVTGAGDAMMAGLVASWFDKKTFASAVRFAQGCSALTICSEFTNNPNLSHDRVQQLLELQQ